ncbi:LacI family DNA-binding transcriptional regulator [Coraliomargarita sp. SDUM461004]|uniref:LacI family DNA-binding transcriptional regulator n=1 Tax=Thalassobacterium sedimentorum TaxID=3041258 RepID=A0ABU1AHK2_9BACT|nr:LacI family DNA-binding transcriptional regulator [Coraliomargarita sp. SDUM461004]MDQ8194167.1 LacI family DNA-binding transcriptional regulator [Coraliomargarita sp. SDUM461004]
MSNKKRKTKSIVDVAERAGVSVTTVSRVLNGQGKVHGDTRARVLDAAKDLEFSLSRGRPGPRLRSAGAEGVIKFLHFIDPDIEVLEQNYTLLPIKEGVSRAAADAGIRVSYDILSTKAEGLPALSSGGRDVVGVLWLGGEPSVAVQDELRKYTCCRMMTARESSLWCDEVRPDHREVGAMAARHLLENGHVNIAMLMFSPNDRVNYFREEGFRHEMSERPDVRWTLTKTLNDEISSGRNENYSVIGNWIQESFIDCSNPPTALFVDSDETLRSVYFRLSELGIIPGRELEIVSCNNLRRIRESLPIEFTSIDVHFESVGRMSVAQLLWRCENRDDLARSRTLIMPSLNSR